MHVIINRIHFGNFRFILELEAGPEIEEPGQLTLWVAEKIDVQTIPLREFTLEQLLYSVKEPLRSDLYLQLETEKQSLQQTFTEKISASFTFSEQKHSSDKVGYKTRELRLQQKKALLHLEQSFRQNELRSLDRTQYDLETLQAESHLFSEERFLHHFRDQEVDDAEIRQFCFQFAFDPVKRAEILAEAVSQPQPMKPIFSQEG